MKLKKIGILILILLLVFTTCFYFYITKDAYKEHIKGVYFSAKSAMDSWDKNPSEILYEFEDENFYIRFCEDEDVFSVKKSEFMWVKNEYNGFPTKSLNSIHSTTVNDVIYIYGVTQKENVEKIIVADSLLNQKNAQFNGEKIESKNALCFCIKLPLKDFVLLESSILLVDGQNRIISELDENNTEEDKLLSSLLENISPDKQTINYEPIGTSSVNYNKTIAEKFFIIRDNNNFYLEVLSEGIDIQFHDDFVLLTEQKTITRTTDTINNTHYLTSYKLEYNDDLIKLKQYTLNKD